MFAASLALVLASVARGDVGIDSRAVFALFERYRSSFHDVSFLHEGTLARGGPGANESQSANRFQTYYAYRSADGATLLDVFGYGRTDRPLSRTIFAILHDRAEFLNASPDSQSVPVARREPVTKPGGPGTLAITTSPETIFLPWYFSWLGEAPEHEPEIQGWEIIDGHRCLRIRMLKQPKSLLKGWVGELPYIQLWVDLERDGYPLRWEFYAGNVLQSRVQISHLERMILPSGRHLWFPATGKSWIYVGNLSKDRREFSTKEPQSIGVHQILLNTVKFNQGLGDRFFSVKNHAKVADDEGLRRLQRQLESRTEPRAERPPSDAEGRQRQLDKALEEADRQADRLEASSAARAGPGWSEWTAIGLGVTGVVLLGGAFLLYRRR